MNVEDAAWRAMFVRTGKHADPASNQCGGQEALTSWQLQYVTADVDAGAIAGSVCQELGSLQAGCASSHGAFEKVHHGPAFMRSSDHQSSTGRWDGAPPGVKPRLLQVQAKKVAARTQQSRPWDRRCKSTKKCKLLMCQLAVYATDHSRGWLSPERRREPAW